MSDGIEIPSICCLNTFMIKKEYEDLKVKLKFPNFEKNFRWYETIIPVYTCKKCNKKWAVERIINSAKQ